LTYCDRCGAVIDSEDKFCPSCGVPLESGVVRRNSRSRRYLRDDDLCFGEPNGDPLGLIEFGLFLLVVGVTFQMNPTLAGDFISWVELMADGEILVRPPQELLRSGTIFFGLISLSNFFTASVRLLLDKNTRRIMSDVFSGVAILALTYLIKLYTDYAITGTMILALEAIVIGGLIIVYFLLRNIL